MHSHGSLVKQPPIFPIFCSKVHKIQAIDIIFNNWYYFSWGNPSTKNDLRGSSLWYGSLVKLLPKFPLFGYKIKILQWICIRFIDSFFFYVSKFGNNKFPTFISVSPPFNTHQILLIFFVFTPWTTKIPLLMEWLKSWKNA